MHRFRGIVAVPFAATLIVLVTMVVPASAQNVIDQPLSPRYMPSCLDLDGNPELNCFGADVAQPGSSCQNYANRCAISCAQQESAAFNACYSNPDPVAQANCIAIAETNWQACQNECDVIASSGMCP
jgi:hypothetical protein